MDIEGTDVSERQLNTSTVERQTGLIPRTSHLPIQMEEKGIGNLLMALIPSWQFHKITVICPKLSCKKSIILGLNRSAFEGPEDQTSSVTDETIKTGQIPKLKVWCDGLQVDHKLAVGTGKVLQVADASLRWRNTNVWRSL